MQPVTEQTVKDFLFGTGTKLTTEQQSMFMQMAVRNNLDPFKKEIYVVSYGKEFNIITGYRVFIDRAERTGLLNGWQIDVEFDDKGSPFKATVTIHRKDWGQPFKWDALAKEFNKKQSTWNTMPGFMLKKVAIAQGFRMCFPSECGNLPYTAEEHEIINMGKLTPEPAETVLTNPLQEKIDSALAGFADIGISAEQVEGFIKKDAESFTQGDIDSLRAYYVQCKADSKPPEETKKDDETTSQDKEKRVNAILDGLGQNGYNEMDLERLHGCRVDELSDDEISSVELDIAKMNAGNMPERWTLNK